MLAELNNQQQLPRKKGDCNFRHTKWPAHFTYIVIVSLRGQFLFLNMVHSHGMYEKFEIRFAKMPMKISEKQFKNVLAS